MRANRRVNNKARDKRVFILFTLGERSFKLELLNAPATFIRYTVYFVASLCTLCAKLTRNLDAWLTRWEKRNLYFTLPPNVLPSEWSRSAQDPRDRLVIAGLSL